MLEPSNLEGKFSIDEAGNQLMLTDWAHVDNFPFEQFVASAVLRVPRQKFFKGEEFR